MLNAIKYTEELEKAGFSKEQANKSVKVWLELMDQNFATRSDLKEFQLTMEVRFAEHKAEFQNLASKQNLDFQNLDSKIKNLESRMIIKLGLMQVASVALLSTIILLSK